MDKGIIMRIKVLIVLLFVLIFAYSRKKNREFITESTLKIAMREN